MSDISVNEKIMFKLHRQIYVPGFEKCEIFKRVIFQSWGDSGESLGLSGVFLSVFGAQLRKEEKEKEEEEEHEQKDGAQSCSSREKKKQKHRAAQITC